MLQQETDTETKNQCEIKQFLSNCDLSLLEVKDYIKNSLFSWLEDHDYYEDNMEDSSSIAFSDLGLTSMDSVGLVEKIKVDFGVDLDATAAWQYPNVASLSNYVADRVQESAQSSVAQELVLNNNSPIVPEELDIAAQLEALLKTPSEYTGA